MPTEPKLLPCRHCHGKWEHGNSVPKLEEISNQDGGGWRVLCYTCGIGTVFFCDSADKAAKLWNARTPSPTPGAPAEWMRNFIADLYSHPLPLDRESAEALLAKYAYPHDLRTAASAVVARWDATTRTNPGAKDKYPLVASEHEALQKALQHAPCDADKPAWRTMEDAPRDGTKVILYAPDTRPFTAQWDAQEYHAKPRPFWNRYGPWGALADRDLSSKVTHWMPLPAPPAAAKEGE